MDDYYINVGCGKCYHCLCNRRRSWLFRLGMESLNSIFSVFLTLTYADEYLPKCLCKSHLTEFLSQLSFDFKYYAIGEYGPQTLRPHYHVVLFVKSPIVGLDLQRHFEACWSKGFVTMSMAHYYRLNYILHYHTRPKEPLPGLKSFQLYSKGLGLNFLFNKDGSVNSSLLAYLQSGGRVVQDLEGNYYVVPRYYTRKLESMGLLQPRPFVTSTVDPLSNMLRVSYNEELYQISDYRWNNLVHDLVFLNKRHIYDYNVQNKFMTAYL